MNRYTRQTNLSEIGIEGQKTLLKSKVLIVGIGGLGSPAALYLAGAGIGTLGLIDSDTVDTTNLQRQIIYSEHEQGRSKVEAAKKRLNQFNSQIEIKIYAERLNEQNVEKIISEYDLILDGTDRYQTKYLINDWCAKLKKPWVYASITGFHGMFAAFSPKQGPCLRCYQEIPPKNYVPDCQTAGVLGAAVGVIGSLQASLAIKALLYEKILSEPKNTKISNNINPQYGKLFAFDIGAMDFLKVPIQKKENCLACEQNKVVEKNTVEEFCRNLNHHFILDVREPEEFKAGSLPQAVNWPLSQLRLNPKELTLPIDQEILVFCHSGARSQTAIEILRSVCNRTFKNLEGGLSNFKN